MRTTRFLFLVAIPVFSLMMMNCQGDANQKISAQSGNTNVKISVTIEGLPDQACRFGGFYGDKFYNIETVYTDENGSFVIERDKALEGGLYFIVLPDNQTFIQFLLGDDQAFSLRTQANDIAGSMEVEGSVDNSAFYESLNAENDIQSRLNEIGEQLKGVKNQSPAYEAINARRVETVEERKEFVANITSKYKGSFFSKFKLAGQNPELRSFYLPDGTPDENRQVYHYRNDFWDNVDFTDDRLLRTPVFHNKLNRFIAELVPQNGDSLVKYSNFITRKTINNDELFKYTANYIALKYKDAKIMDWEKVYVNMVQNYFTHELAFWSDSIEIKRLQLQIIPMRASLLGNDAQNIVCKDANGTEMALLDLGSRYIILFIYNPTCDNCVKETPELIRFYNEWKSKGVEVYALSIDADRKDWEDYLAKYSPPWKHNLFDQNNESGFGYKYHVDHTPELYVINSERKIIGKNLKSFQLPIIIEQDLTKSK